MCTVRAFLTIFAPFLVSKQRGDRVLCARFVHFLPYLHHFWAPNCAVTACCVHSSCISYHICTIFGLPSTRERRAVCTVRAFLNIFAPFLGSQLRGNHVLCAQFVHFLSYLHHFWAPNYAVTACRVHSSRISYHICTIFGLQTTR